MLRLIKSLFASMSLERKCLLFFGSALLVLMFGAILVAQVLARWQVLKTKTQRAMDFKSHALYLLHQEQLWDDERSPDLRSDMATQNRLVLSALKAEFLDETIEFEILGLDTETTTRFDHLPFIPPPESIQEQEELRNLEGEFRSKLAKSIETSQADITNPLELNEIETMARIGVDQEAMSQGLGSDDRFILYAPIWPQESCFSCHSPQGKQSAISPDDDPVLRSEQVPFRVMKVTMPDSQSDLSTIRSMGAIVLSMAMLIVAVTLFILHAIVRYLVLQPLYHLRDVSDAITHGETNQRALIDTEDEFRELADAFNRMLRHMTETRQQVEEVNLELDARVDQFAQLNLQLYEANRLKSDFLANMSHELRTPLNSIIGFSEVLQGIESLDEKQKRYAANIQKSGRLLLEMINDILDLAKVEAGKMEVKRCDTDLKRLVSAQCDMIGALSEDKNISVDQQVPSNLPMAFQDPNKLGQILNNLLSNAIKFTPEGGIISVSIDNLGDRFRLSVRDTGVGIAEEDHDVIFQKFRQSKKVLDGEGLTREFAGTGLGLSIVKELAKLLGGEVDFESELGRGSTFWVSLPWQLRNAEIFATSHAESDHPNSEIKPRPDSSIKPAGLLPTGE